MLNGFLGSQGFPPHTFFDPQRPSETISNLLDYVAREHFHTKVSTVVYVKPAVKYVKDLFKIGQARVLLQKFNATEMSDKLSDAVNLEVSFLPSNSSKNKMNFMQSTQVGATSMNKKKKTNIYSQLVSFDFQNCEKLVGARSAALN